MLRKRQPYFVFHWRGGAPGRSLLEQILKSASALAAGKGQYARLSANMSQAVMELSFSENAAVSDICEEQADEGEDGGA